MKKLMVVIMAVASLGVFADKEADTNASTSENQVATPEGIGVGMRMDALQKRTQVKRSAIVRVENAKIDAFLKSHFGVQFGDSEDEFTNVVQLITGEARVIPVRQEVGCLKSAIGCFRNGKLRTVYFIASGICGSHTSPVPEKLQGAYACVAKELNLDPNDVKPFGLVFGVDGYCLHWNSALFDCDGNGLYNVRFERGEVKAVSLFARRSSSSRLGRRRRSLMSEEFVELPMETYEKIPKEYQSTLRSKINDIAVKQATLEASDKFGVLFTPQSWTNNCDKGMIAPVQGQGRLFSLFIKCDRDGKIVQMGRWSDFEEVKWRDARRDEIVTNLWNDQQLVNGLLATAVSNDVRRTKRRVVQKESRRAENCGSELDSLIKQTRRELLPLMRDNDEMEEYYWEEQMPQDLCPDLRKVDSKVVQTNVDAFLEKHLSVRFGDPITNFPVVVAGGVFDCLREVPVMQKFRHFDHAIGKFVADKLCEVYFFVDVPKKYSKASAEERIDQDLFDLAKAMGIPSKVFKHTMSFRLSRSPYVMKKHQATVLTAIDGEGYGSPQGVYRFGIVVSARDLRNKFMDEEIAKEAEEKAREENKGEEFPDVK